MPAICCADAAVKAANVTLIGYEITKGGGQVTVKLGGDVGAVQAAVAAGAAAVEQIGRVIGTLIIPRPHAEIKPILFNKENIIYSQTAVGAQPANGEESPAGDVPEPLPVAGTDAPPNSGGDGSGGEEAVITTRSHRKATCNICGDPECPRHKGDPHDKCIHAGDNS